MASRQTQSDRRSFLSALSVAGTWLATSEWTLGAFGAPRVNATPTVFYAPPDGTNNLVRFTVTGVTAPAGRLRVYDRSRRLLGTAGVLRRGGTLYGELWLPLVRPQTIVSELEAPGIRGPLRSTHRLAPQRRWVIHLFTVLDPSNVVAELINLPLYRRAVQVALCRRHGAGVNPVPTAGAGLPLDHIALLRSVAAATEQARALGLEVSRVGTAHPERPLSPGLVQVLTGSQVSVLIDHAGEEPFHWLAGPDGSRIVVASGSGAAEELGFGSSPEIAVSRVEDWLASQSTLASPASDRGVAVIASLTSAAASEGILRSVADWNRRFAFPTVVPNDATGLMEDIARTAGPDMPVLTAAHTTTADTPTMESLVTVTKRLRQADVERTRNIIATLSGLLDEGSSDIAAVASEVNALVNGTLVFNPSPFARSELLRLEDGSERVVTDIPGLGYAYLPDARVGTVTRWLDLTSGAEISGSNLRLRIDRSTGAIESLTDVVRGTEWVRPGSPGLNAVDAARVERVTLSRLPDVASRVTIDRWSPGRGGLRTMLTLYDRLPWLDITNDAEGVGPSPLHYAFHLNVASPDVAWEVAGGYQQSRAPVDWVEHLRWLRLGGPRAALLIAGLDTSSASIAENGTLVSHAGRGIARYRLGLQSEFDSPDLPWQFGWGTTPMVLAKVLPTGAGRLPTFGSLLDIDRTGVAVLGIVPSADRNGIVLYLQELLGLRREVSVGWALVRFASAQQVDLVERPIGEPLMPANGSVAVTVPARGIVAVRLSQLGLAVA